METKFLDFKREANVLIEEGLMDEIQEVLLSGHYLFGPKLEELEKKLSVMLNAEVIMVGSGTDALYLSLKALGIEEGKVVAIPAFSAIPTAIAVKMTGADVTYVDIDDTGTMSVDELKNDLEIDAVVPVHLFGNIASVEEIVKVCDERGIPVVEDCAQSFGSKIADGYTGTYGVFGAYSFYPSKNLGAYGDAGAVATTNSRLAEKIREMRFYGQKTKNAMGEYIGMNSRVDEIQAAILLKKLKALSVIEERKLKLFRKYMHEFGDITINWSPHYKMPHIFPIFVPNRNQFIHKMKELGVEVGCHYPFTLPENMMGDYIPMKNWKCYEFSRHIVSLPFNPWLTKAEVEYIIKCAHNAMNISII